ncbi:MAG: zinc ribbon domain-containing protein [Gemmatimonadota bacterium]
MTQQTYSTLQELQRLDEEIDRLEAEIRKYDPLIAQVEEPARELEGEVETTETRLQELELEERRLELAVQEKRERLQMLKDRLNEVRNVREEAAVQAELDMVRRSVESDEQEALSLLDQIRKAELRLDEQKDALEQEQDEIEPRRRELLAQQKEARERLDEVKSERERVAGKVEERERRVYDRIRSGGRDVAVAPLTADGACSHCFGMVPVQRRNEIRAGGAMIRCEACGVILAPPRGANDEGDGPEAGSSEDEVSVEDEG